MHRCVKNANNLIWCSYIDDDRHFLFSDAEKRSNKRRQYFLPNCNVTRWLHLLFWILLVFRRSLWLIISYYIFETNMTQGKNESDTWIKLISFSRAILPKRLLNLLYLLFSRTGSCGNVNGNFQKLALDFEQHSYRSKDTFSRYDIAWLACQLPYRRECTVVLSTKTIIEEERSVSRDFVWSPNPANK